MSRAIEWVVASPRNCRITLLAIIAADLLTVIALTWGFVACVI